MALINDINQGLFIQNWNKIVKIFSNLNAQEKDPKKRGKITLPVLRTGGNCLGLSDAVAYYHLQNLGDPISFIEKVNAAKFDVLAQAIYENDPSVRGLLNFVSIVKTFQENLDKRFITENPTLIQIMGISNDYKINTSVEAIKTKQDVSKQIEVLEVYENIEIIALGHAINVNRVGENQWEVYEPNAKGKQLVQNSKEAVEAVIYSLNRSWLVTQIKFAPFWRVDKKIQALSLLFLLELMPNDKRWKNNLFFPVSVVFNHISKTDKTIPVQKIVPPIRNVRQNTTYFSFLQKIFNMKNHFLKEELVQATESLAYDYLSYGKFEKFQQLNGQKNFDINKKLWVASSYKYSPISAAVRSNNCDLVNYLVNDLKANVNVIDECETVNKTYDIYAAEREAPLHSAAFGSPIGVFKCLLNAEKVDLNIRDSNARTPLYSAIRGGNLEHVHLLIGSKANLSVTDKGGNTPLHFAVLCGNSQMVKILLDASVDVTVKNKQGLQAIGLALINGEEEIYKMIKEKMGNNIENYIPIELNKTQIKNIEGILNGRKLEPEIQTDIPKNNKI